MPKKKKTRKLTPGEKKKLGNIIAAATSTEQVAAIVDVIDVGVANELLGGPISAARQRIGARRTGHTKADTFRASGGLEGLKKSKKFSDYQKAQKARPGE